MMSSCHPTSLFATRYTTLPTFDLSVGGGGGGEDSGGGGGGDGGGGGGGGGNSFAACSPSSPVSSWEDHIREISRELHVICGSPRSRTRDRMLPPRQTNHHHQHHHTPPLTRHLSMGCMLRSPSAALASTPAFPPPPPPKRQPTPLTRTESHDRIVQFLLPEASTTSTAAPLFCPLQRPEPSANCHRLVVRHEETSSRLNEQLARVCPLKSPAPEEILTSSKQPRTEAAAASPMTKYVEHRRSDSYIPIRRQTSAKTGVLYKVPIDQHKPEMLFASLVDGDRLLRVCAADDTNDVSGDNDSPSSFVVLEEVTIPTEVSVQSLVLSVAGDDRWLYVQERGSGGGAGGGGGAMVADFSGTSAKYLPIVRENEAASQVEIFLRVPDEFDPDEVLVKTVDDRVVVTGSRRPVSVLLGDELLLGGPSLASPLTIGGHSWSSSPGVHFVVILALPSGSENRTVSAYFVRPHQLLITGRLRPNLRRYTF